MCMAVITTKLCDKLKPFWRSLSRHQRHCYGRQAWLPLLRFFGVCDRGIVLSFSPEYIGERPNGYVTIAIIIQLNCAKLIPVMRLPLTMSNPLIRRWCLLKHHLIPG